MLMSVVFIAEMLYGQPQWDRIRDFGGSQRAEAVFFTIGEKGYIVTGQQYENFTYVCKKDLWELDPVTNTWTQKADFPGPGRYAAFGFSINAKGYLGYGLSSPFNYLTDFWEYDVNENSWTEKANIGILPREGAVAITIGDKGYIGTGTCHGTQSNGRLKDWWEYNPKEDKWTQKADFKGEARTSAVSFTLNSKGYLGCGLGESNALADFWEYDPAIDMWAEKAAFKGGPRISAVGFSIANYGYVGTGYKEIWAEPQIDFWEYSGFNNSWVKVEDFEGSPRAMALGFAIGQKGYIGLGTAGGDTRFKDFWRFSSPSNIWEPVNTNTANATICPNPNKGKFDITINTIGIETFDLTLYNQMGGLIDWNNQVDVKESVMLVKDYSYLEPGVYFLIISNSTNQIVKRVVII